MISVFRFPLADVLDLAEHAVAATEHADPVGDEPAGPALLLVGDDGVYLMSNGLPQPPPAPGQPAASTVRAVFAEHLGRDSDSPSPDGEDLLIALPLRQPGTYLVDQLRGAASAGLGTVIITVLGRQVTVLATHAAAPRQA